MSDNKLEKLNIAATTKEQSSVENSSVEAEKTVEKEKNLENDTEKNIELEEEKKKKKLPVINKIVGLAAQSSPANISKKREAEIDKILSDGLNDIYIQMSPQKKQQFKVEGEVTVKKINILLGESKIKVKKIIDLIKKWLQIIPGVNKFFLEQETKLKTDKIMKINKSL